jgi:hypothetical protein
MTYTQIAVVAVIVAVLADLFLFRTKLVTKKVFWVSYAIIFFFQLITNGMFTGFGIVQYDGDAIIGSSSPAEGAPPFLGDGRISFAPAEDLMFGFSLVLLSLCLWVLFGRWGLSRRPTAGPPLWRTVRKGR